MRTSLVTVLVVACVATAVLLGLARAEPPVAQVDVDAPYTPDAVLALVAADLSAATYTRTTRYLSLDDLITDEARALWETVTNAHLQFLSGEPGIALAVRVGPLLRIDTRDYGDVFAEQWERLGRQEPFWHGDDIAVEDEEEDFYWKGGKDVEGNYFPAGTYRRKRATAGKAVRRFFTRTPEGKKAFETIAVKTRGTDVPVVRATWFLAQTATNWQRDPGYYAFCGVKDLATFERVIGFVRDKKQQNPAFLRDVRAATGSSGVTAPDTLRRMFRFNAPTGGFYGTQDSDQRVARFDPKADPLTNLGDDYVFQAFEGIGYGANKFPKTVLTDNKGVLQDRAPDNIAGTKMFRHKDTRILINVACIGCHTNGYVQDVDDWVRKDLNADGLLGTKLGEDVARKIRSEYVTQYLEPHFKSDRESYAEVLWQVTKMKPAAFAKVYVEAFESATYDRVTQDVAARQLGTTKEEMVKAFLASGEKLDLGLVPLRNKEPRALPVVTWQGRFQRAADAVHGVARPFAVKEK